MIEGVGTPLLNNHYRKTLLCHVPAAHGETVKTHGKTVVVR
jgi:hypothetical protein